MVVLPDYWTQEIQGLIDEGRTTDAYDRALEYLQNGFHSVEFSKLVAEMWKSTPTKWLKPDMGRPVKNVPSNWHQIGQLYYALQIGSDEKKPLTAKEALAEILKEFGIEDRTFQKCRAYYNKAMKADEDLKNELRGE